MIVSISGLTSYCHWYDLPIHRRVVVGEEVAVEEEEGMDEVVEEVVVEEVDGVVVVDHPVGVDLVVPVEEEDDRRVEALPVAEVVLVDDPLVAEEDEGVLKCVYHSMTYDSIKLYKHTYSDENVFYFKKGMTYINTL